MFEDLSDVFDPSLRLPIRGKEYVIPAPSASVGLRLEALQAVVNAVRAGREVSERDRQALKMDDAAEMNLHRECLGAAYDEMIAADVSIAELRHAGNTAYLYWTLGREAAERFWRSEQGKAHGSTSP